MAFQYPQDPSDRDPRSQLSTQYDPRIGTTVAASPGAVRAAFLQKVYLTLCAGVAIAMGTAFYVLQSAIAGSPELMAMVTNNYLVTFVIYIVLAIAAGAVAQMRGVNIIVFGIFTAFTGLLISPLFAMAYTAAGGSTAIIWNAFGLSTLVFGGLTAYVFVSGKDFSFLKGFVWMGFLVLIGFMVATVFVDSPAFHKAVTAGGIFVFAAFVLYDTSQIMHRYEPTQWVAGALSLFVDFINIFVRILSLLSSRD